MYQIQPANLAEQGAKMKMDHKIIHENKKHETNTL